MKAKKKKKVSKRVRNIALDAQNKALNASKLERWGEVRAFFLLSLKENVRFR